MKVVEQLVVDWCEGLDFDYMWYNRAWVERQKPDRFSIRSILTPHRVHVGTLVVTDTFVILRYPGMNMIRVPLSDPGCVGKVRCVLVGWSEWCARGYDGFRDELVEGL